MINKNFNNNKRYKFSKIKKKSLAIAYTIIRRTIYISRIYEYIYILYANNMLSDYDIYRCIKYTILYWHRN